MRFSVVRTVSKSTGNLQQKQKAELIKMLTSGLSIDQAKKRQAQELEAFDDGELAREVRKREL
jgi:hypothetical protein